jgi:hypothetical protein
MTSPPRHLVFSNSFSAWHLQRGLRLLGHQLESAHPMLGLVRQATAPPRPGDQLYFTDENMLLQYLDRRDMRFSPRIDNRFIDDKLAFSEWLTSIGEIPVRYARLPATPAAFPVVLKARHSWQDGRRLSRGVVCTDATAWQRACRNLADSPRGFAAAFLQEFVPGAGKEFSTCGFFDVADPRRTAMLVVRRTVSMGGNLPSGAVVETTADPADLLPRTCNLLARLDYTGPFELEFLRRQDGRYVILELNPRFWMQHGLFIDFYDNVLLRRYVDPCDTTPLPDSHGDHPAVWLNAWHAFRAGCRGDVRALTAYAEVLDRAHRGRARARWYPSWSAVARFTAQAPYRRVSRFIRAATVRPSSAPAA